MDELLADRAGARDNAGVHSFSCTEVFCAMAFAQLPWRERLRHIEASLSANASKLYAMEPRAPVRRCTLADANESRDWRMWSDLAARLICRARKLYASESLGVEFGNTVYALDSSIIDLCLSLFDWAPFCSSKAAIKLHMLLDLRGAIPVKHFLGTSEKVVKTQVWCAVATYVLIAIVKKKLQLDASLYTVYRFCRSRASRKPSCHAPYRPIRLL